MRDGFDFEEPQRNDRAMTRAVLGGVAMAGGGLVALFTIGKPLGWPLGWWFNAMFIGMGAVFFGLGLQSVLNKTNNFVFLIVGPGILILAVFMGGLFSSFGGAPGALRKGEPKAVLVCQSAPFYACLKGGKYLGRFEGTYEAAVEPGGRISEVQMQSNLRAPARRCVLRRIRALRATGHQKGRMAVRCQFIGSAIHGQFEIRMSRGYRKLAPGEKLSRPRPRARAAARTPSPAPRPRTLPVEDPNVDVRYDNPLVAPNCRYFSGPPTIGAVDVLGTKGLLTRGKRHATLMLGQNLAFSGRAQGKKLTLQRKSRYKKDRFEVTETLTLTSTRGGVLQGKYRYQECDRTGDQGCPNQCRIQADVTVKPH